jgi:hypothetical protein
MGKNKEVPRISVNALERIAKSQSKDTTVMEWNGVEIHIKHFLPLKDVIGFCDDAASLCFTDDGRYIPEILDFAVRVGVLSRYANFAMPDNIEARYWLVYNTDAYETVLEHVNSVQLNNMVASIEMRVEYECDSNISLFQSKMTKLLESFDAMQKSTKSLFEGFSQESLDAIVAAAETMQDGVVNEEKIVNAYMDRVQKDASDNIIHITDK